MWQATLWLSLLRTNWGETDNFKILNGDPVKVSELGTTPKQVIGKSYVRFLNSTSSPLTGSGTFKMFPLYDSDGDASTSFAQGRARRPVMTVSGNIADSDGTMNVRRTDLSTNDNDKFVIDSDGLSLAGQKVSIPSKYNLTIINAAGSTAATFKFLDPS